MSNDESDDEFADIELLSSAMEDWWDMRGCKRKPSRLDAKQVNAAIGPRAPGEPVDKYMDRAFTKLRELHPAMFA